MRKEKKDQAGVWYNVFTTFFFKYFLLGLCLILLFVIYDIELKSYLNDYPFWGTFLKIVFSIMGIIGPSLLVASFFTFSIESKRFIEYTKDQLEKVMIKKEFLDKLNDVDKKEALRRILTPSDDKYQLFSNIKNYFEETIEKAMSLFECTFKSNFSIDVNAIIKDNQVCLEETLNQKIYKGKNGFDPIIFGFDESEFVPETEFISVQYVLPNGICKELKKEDFNITRGEEESGFKWIMYSYDIPKSIEAEFISEIIRFREYGYDHWQLFAYKTMIPSEGIKVAINCADGLIIKDHLIFDNDKNYVCHISEDKKRIDLYTSQWISPGNGINVLIAKE